MLWGGAVDSLLERLPGEVEGEFGADAVEVALEFAGAGEGGLHVGQDVFRAYVLEEVGVGDDLRGADRARRRAEAFAGFVQAVRETARGRGCRWRRARSCCGGAG